MIMRNEELEMRNGGGNLHGFPGLNHPTTIPLISIPIKTNSGRNLNHHSSFLISDS
jgi:hypothetical protein